MKKKLWKKNKQYLKKMMNYI